MEKRSILIGDSASVTKTVTELDVDMFARVTGDYNPVHMDEEEGRKSVFGKRTVHGLLTGSLISAVLANTLPGPGTIYLEQSFRFKAPVFIGDICTAEVKISDILNHEKGIYRMDTNVSKQDGSIVLEGYAIVMYKETGKEEKGTCGML